MSSDLALRVQGVSKSYTVRHRLHDHVTLAQTALERIRHPFQREEREQFWALRDVSFELMRGVVLGIVGRNGAGKSTLLKLITEITSPTAGQIELWGRVGSLLEVGTGFHPELSGRENIYLNGAIMGMRRAEIDGQFDAIVDFAGVENFLDTPVKRFSSGMYVRLAFAVAAHLQSEILVVDEVLAVGDVEFQQRCLEKLRSVAEDGRTVLLVSHQLATIQQNCSSALWLDRGCLAGAGTSDEVVSAYLADLDESPSVRNRSSEQGHLHSIVVSAPVSAPDELREIQFVVDAREVTFGRAWVSAHVVDQEGRVVIQCDSRTQGLYINPEARANVQLSIARPWLKPGRYRVDLFLCGHEVIDLLVDAARFSVLDHLPYSAAVPHEAVAAGIVLAEFEYRCQDSCDYPTDVVDSIRD